MNRETFCTRIFTPLSAKKTSKNYERPPLTEIKSVGSFIIFFPTITWAWLPHLLHLVCRQKSRSIRTQILHILVAKLESRPELMAAFPHCNVLLHLCMFCQHHNLLISAAESVLRRGYSFVLNRDRCSVSCSLSIYCLPPEKYHLFSAAAFANGRFNIFPLFSIQTCVGGKPFVDLKHTYDTCV